MSDDLRALLGDKWTSKFVEAAVSDLRGILGDRYDDVIEKTARHMHTLEWMGVEEEAELAWDHYPVLGPARQEYLRWAEAVLSFVVPGLLTAERERALAAEATAGTVREHPRREARDADPYRKEIPDEAR